MKEPSIFEDISDERDDLHSFGGVWTLIKLETIEKYLAAFNTALSKQNFTRIYIDAFAGTGRCSITKDGEKVIIEGSARRALTTNPPFHKFLFIELATRKLEALKSLMAEYPEKDIEVIKDDTNVVLKALCNSFDTRNTRAVLFLDPYGMHVEWPTLQAIAQTGGIDVWYLFPYSALYRQAAKSADAMDADKVEAITRLLGTDEWRKHFYAPKRQQSLFGSGDGEERIADHQEMLKYVTERLKRIFSAVSEPKILYQVGNSKSPSGAPLFALYFASSNPKPKAHGLALKIAKDVLKSL